MRESLEQFVFLACANEPSTIGILTLEILSGCAACGRRLLEAGDMVRAGTLVLDVRDELTDEVLAKHALCNVCVYERTHA